MAGETECKYLVPDEIILVDNRLHKVVEVTKDEIEGHVVFTECLEPKPDEPAKWCFPVANKRGLRAFTKYSRRVLH